MNKWLELVASEEMDSQGAYHTILAAVQTVKEIIGDPESTLCIGCGAGVELGLFDHATGIDLNEQSLVVCREAGYTAEKMDMHAMTFPDGKFELVFSRDVFEHAVSPIEAISEMARVSKKYVAVILPDESWQSSKWHFIIPTMKQMISLGEKVGLLLQSYREYDVIIGNTDVHQYVYIFRKL